MRDKQSVKEMVRFSKTVVNLIGREFNTWSVEKQSQQCRDCLTVNVRHFKMGDAMGEGARTIARACQEAGVKQLIHVSALNASLDSPSTFLQAKVET